MPHFTAERLFAFTGVGLDQAGLGGPHPAAMAGLHGGAVPALESLAGVPVVRGELHAARKPMANIARLVRPNWSVITCLSQGQRMMWTR